MSRTCTRRLEFDAAHRVLRHESKCRHLHGHRYVLEVTCSARDLDALGRVIDFGVVKDVFGAWVDEMLDHGTLINEDDAALLDACIANGWKHYVMGCNPTAENIASELHGRACSLLEGCGVQIERVRVYETPNCWADYP